MKRKGLGWSGFILLPVSALFLFPCGCSRMPLPSTPPPAPSWKVLGNANFALSGTFDCSLYVDGSTPYFANGTSVYVLSGGLWSPLGGATTVGGSFVGLQVSNGIPSIAFSDASNGQGSSVLQFAGGAWSYLGNPDFSNNTAYYESYAVSNGVPYVAYDSPPNASGTVEKFVGGAWVTVGSSFSSGTNYMSLALDNGVPYVAFQDTVNGSGISSMKFDGTSWVYVGAPNFSNGFAVKINLCISNGTPYVAYQDMNVGVVVMKFNGTSWVALGTPDFTGPTNDFSLFVDRGTPYLAYQDTANNYNYLAKVVRYNGSTWSTVGAADFSPGPVADMSLFVSNGTPYLAYSDHSTSQTTVMKYY